MKQLAAWGCATTIRKVTRAGDVEDRVVARLCLGGQPLHELRGLHGDRVLREVAGDWMNRGYVPSVLAMPSCWGDYLSEPARYRRMTR